MPNLRSSFDGITKDNKIAFAVTVWILPRLAAFDCVVDKVVERCVAADTGQGTDADVCTDAVQLFGCRLDILTAA